MKKMIFLLGGFLNAITAFLLNAPIWTAFIFFTIGLVTYFAYIISKLIMIKEEYSFDKNNKVKCTLTKEEVLKTWTEI